VSVASPVIAELADEDAREAWAQGAAASRAPKQQRAQGRVELHEPTLSQSPGYQGQRDHAAPLAAPASPTRLPLLLPALVVPL
jgi:hypothetical protein